MKSNFNKWTVILGMSFFLGCAITSCSGSKTEEVTEEVSLEIADTGTISDAVLSKFLEVDEVLRPIQKEAENKMLGIIAAKGMSIERYMEIANTPKTADGEAFPEEELQVFDEINMELEGIESGMMDGYHKKIEEMGFSVENYQRLVQRIYNDPALQSRLSEMNKSKTGETLPQ